MKNSNIIDKIKTLQDIITEEDVEAWVIPDLLEHYSAKIHSLARYTYGNHTDGTLMARAFKAEALGSVENPGALRKGLHTFLFKSQHWRDGRDLNTYLLTCLNRLSSKLRSDIECAKKVNVPICPACRVYKQREFLLIENHALRCNACTSAVEQLKRDLKSDISDEQKNFLQGKLQLSKIFMLHTRRGYRCPECERFVPHSYIDQYGVSCPYSECCWFGTKHELELMAHPSGLSNRLYFSLNDHVSKDIQKDIWQDRLESNDVSADVLLSVNQTFDTEHQVLKEVIELQMKRAQASISVRSFQKVLMYQSYAKLLEGYPYDMVSYLVHMKHISGSAPIQARIFQEYVRQIENNLPFSIFKGSEEIEIYSLQDPNLNLFLGISEFEALVKADHSIPNNTEETYIGGQKLKDYGPCFIGMLIDVIDLDTSESIKDSVVSYTFVKINMNESIAPGTKVNVTHFRTFSHYEMGGMVNLQRVRRKIVDSVYRRLHGKSRNEKD